MYPRTLAPHALLAAAALAAAPALAQPSDTVRVGKDLKRTVGTVTRVESGDVACYLHLRDDNGAPFTELADFDLCTREPSLQGKRVRLQYQVAKVMAASCQGDPACRKSDTVALVTAATRIDAPVAQARPSAGAGAQASFCTPLETVVFACRTGAKLVSVCASRDLTRTAGYVQYRFGRPGEPLEMILPEGHVHPGKAATGESVAFSGGGGAWLRFRSGPVAYVVYTGIGRWGPGGRTAEKQGLVVERGGKQVASLKCTSRVTSELGPDWFAKAGVGTRKDEEFDFPE